MARMEQGFYSEQEWREGLRLLVSPVEAGQPQPPLS